MKRLFTVAVVTAVGGCSLFGFDGFSGGADPDAGTTPTGDGNTGDGPSSSTDGEVIDTGGDAAPSGPFCKTIGADAAVCDDFEEPGTFSGKWPHKDTYLGTLEVLDAIGIGGGRGLRFGATPRADGKVGQDGRVVLGYTSPTAASYVDAELAVKLTSILGRDLPRLDAARDLVRRHRADRLRAFDVHEEALHEEPRTSTVRERVPPTARTSRSSRTRRSCYVS